jgi:hypothetical protein
VGHRATLRGIGQPYRPPVSREPDFDPSMPPRIVWGAPLPEQEPLERRLRQQAIERRRRSIAAAVTLFICVGAFVETVALTTRPVTARSEPLPDGVPTQIALTTSPPSAPTAAAPPSSAAWSVAAMPVPAVPEPPGDTPSIPVASLPKAPLRTTVAPSRVSAARPMATRAVKRVHVHVEPTPVPAVGDPFVAAARQPVVTQAPPAPVATPSRPDDGF